MHLLRASVIVVALFCLAGLGPAMAQTQPALETSVEGDVLILRPQIDHRAIYLTLQAADGSVQQLTFDAASEVVVPLRDVAGEPLPDGLVSWDVVLEPELGIKEKEALVQARVAGETLSRQALVDRGWLPAASLRAYGEVVLTAGRAPAPAVEAPNTDAESALVAAPVGVDLAERETGFLAEEQLITGDLIVRNSLCVGFDCLNPENFSFDTIRLKENSLRIHFDDTSGAPFPANDWRIEVNSSSSGGANYIAFADATSGRTPFRVTAGAPSHSLVVDSQGDAGFGTLTPVVNLHVVDGDSPTLRLQQDASSGFGAYTWDVVGNETNFFVRDSSGGSTLPFRIRPGADSNSIYIDGDNDIGFGTANPAARLHIQATENTNFGGLRVVNTGTGNIQTQFSNISGTPWEWRQTFRSGDLIFDSQEDGANELVLTTGGQLTVVSLVETSDRAVKENFRTIDRQSVLAKIVDLPISRWNYIEQGAGIEHIGPMAQDFHGAFGIGPDDRHIATRDAASVALVGVQALNELVHENRDQLRQLETQQQTIDQLVRRLAALEAAVSLD